MLGHHRSWAAVGVVATAWVWACGSTDSPTGAQTSPEGGAAGDRAGEQSTAGRTNLTGGHTGAGDPSVESHGGGRGGNGGAAGDEVGDVDVAGTGADDGGAAGSLGRGGENGDRAAGGQLTMAPLGGQAGTAGSVGGNGGAAANPNVPAWKVCDSETCAANEICIHTIHGDQASPRVCQQYPRQELPGCDPEKLPQPDSGVADCCKNLNQPLECSRPYWKCSTMDDLDGNTCGWCRANDSQRYECGPPN